MAAPLASPAARNQPDAESIEVAISPSGVLLPVTARPSSTSMDGCRTSSTIQATIEATPKLAMINGHTQAPHDDSMFDEAMARATMTTVKPTAISRRTVHGSGVR